MKFIKVYKPKNEGHSWAAVDDDKFEYLNQWKWRFNSWGYILRGERKNGDYKAVFMHREVLKPMENEVIDHINLDKTNNTLKNLRACSNAQNVRNIGLRKDNKSGYKGVHYNKFHQKWCSQITVNNKQINLGYFDCKHQAALVYNNYAKELHEDFAWFNKINKPPAATDGMEKQISMTV